MAALKIGGLPRALRNVRPSLVALAMISPVSLLALYLWGTTPPAIPPYGSHLLDTGVIVRSVVFLIAWMLMTAAMMLPSAMPLLVSLDRMAQKQAGRRELPVVAALAYLAVWGLVGVGALIMSTVAESYLLPQSSTQVASRVAGGCLVLAGLYGLSPMANACLRACRQPFGFLARYWSGGSSASLQAARIGAAYGVSCVGCCVPMLGIMFVVGMTNIALVIAMGALMVIMKSSVVGTRVAQVLSILLIALGVAVGFAWLPLSLHHH